MNLPPHDFQRQLDAEFHGRFRLRWSQHMGEWHLEQKVQTGQVIPPPLDEDTGTYDTYSDGWRRASDGYFYVMSIRTGDRMPCPVCHLPLRVPHLATREVTCENCQYHSRDGKYKAAYYPLNHLLIEHIRRIDPLNSTFKRGEARRKMNDRMAHQQQQQIDTAELRIMDDKIQVEDRPMVGFGPKTAQRHEGLQDRLR